jgi:hypothetical protein
VDDADGVRLGQRVGHGDGDPQHLAGRLGAALPHQLRQRSAVHVLRHVERDLVGVLGLAGDVTEVVDAQGVRVRQARQRERFLDEVLVTGLRDAGVAGEACKDLDTNRPRQALVAAEVHHAVTAVGDVFHRSISIEHQIAGGDRRGGGWLVHQSPILTPSDRY